MTFNYDYIIKYKEVIIMIIGQDIVADVVTDYPKTADIFRSVGIDFYCEGNESIEKVVGSKKMLI